MAASAVRLLPETRLLTALFVIWVVVVPQAKAQAFLERAEREKAAHLFDGSHTPAPLNCQIRPLKPFLDFAFRFDAGYVIRCPLRAFEGQESKIYVFVRVTPEGREPTLLGESFRLPAAAPQMYGSKSSKMLKQHVETSGGFSLGDGQYKVEVLVADERSGRTSRKSWKVHTTWSGRQRGMTPPIPANTVLPIGVRPRPFRPDTSGKGLRITILLDAAPINPRQQKLRAWDRTFLLGSLSTLLNQIPCASVRVVALSLDHQREVFRREQFEDPDFDNLAEALRTLELGTVSYQVLQRRSGWLDLLMDFVNRELSARDPSDAVIILGPYLHYNYDVPRGTVKARETPHPYFCYFQYVPGNPRWYGYPDAVEGLTKRLKGSVYRIQSAAHLAHAIQKMLTQVSPSGPQPADSRWPPRPAPKP